MATPPPWYDLCLYVYRNAVKDSKKGLSRAALTAAATGKTGQTAHNVGKLLFEAGEAISQSTVDGRLLPPDRNLTQHLAAINALPEASKRVSRVFWRPWAVVYCRWRWSW